MLGIRRQNVWANTVFASAFVALLLVAGGPLGVIKPWTDSLREPANSLGNIEVTAEREYLNYDSRPAAADHLLFGLEAEPVADDDASSVQRPSLGGAWLYSKTGTECRNAPEVSIHLRESSDEIFGYGLIAPTGCGSHAAGEIDYTIVQGRRQDGVIVFTILEKTDGHMLYRFEGELSRGGLHGRLAHSDGSSVADGLIFAPDPEFEGRL